jgi:hypothetical protein
MMSRWLSLVSGVFQSPTDRRVLAHYSCIDHAQPLCYPRTR